MSKIENINLVLTNKIIWGSIYWENNIITKIIDLGSEKKDSNKYVLPGLIDPHVHLREPGLTYKETISTGTQAALHGGITTVFDMPNTIPPVIDNIALNDKITLFKTHAIVNWRLFVGASHNNLVFLEQLNSPHIAGIKVFLGSSTGNLLIEDDNVLTNIWEIGAKKNLIIAVHAELESALKKYKILSEDQNNPANHSLSRPNVVAELAVAKCIDLCQKTGAKTHICHVSTAEELALIAQAKKNKLPISCEVSPHHLFFNTDDYSKYGNLIKMNPPIRSAQDQLAVWQYLKNGTIDCIATDHAPHLLSEKQSLSCPAGVPGLETMLPVLLYFYQKNQISLIDIANWGAKNVADLWNLNTGELAVGKQADLIILDFKNNWLISEENLKTKCAWTPWQGLNVHGELVQVFCSRII